VVTIPLRSRLETKPARSVEKERLRTVDGDELTLEIDKAPRMMHRAIAQRAAHRRAFVDDYS
jgi:hypothetical protein